jgi:hypothetical protein
MYHRWTIRELRALRELAAASKTRREAAAALGLPIGIVRQAARHYGVAFIRAAHTRHDPTPRKPAMGCTGSPA